MKNIKVADEVWIATALLHREHPEREDFSVAEILDRARSESTSGAPLRPGVNVHASQHCVAGRKPNPGRYRMLTETARGRRRLFRSGDLCHPARQSAKQVPAESDLPSRYRELLTWYAEQYLRQEAVLDPILSLRGLGKAIATGEDPDAYVQRLREGWR